MTNAIPTCCSCSCFLSVPKAPPCKFPVTTISKEFLRVDKKWSTLTISHLKSASLLCSSSASSTPTIQEDEQEAETTAPDDVPLESQPSLLNQDSNSASSMRGCKACGREEIERGCNGEGRIQGGIATIPGFGWWPIKAYRPCPGFLAAGGRYRRTGQNMDEIGFGGGDRRASMATDNKGKSRKKK